MKTLLVSAALFVASLTFAADEPPAKSDAKESGSMKARMLEDAKKKAAEAAAKAPSPAATPLDEPRRSSKSEGGPSEKPAATTPPEKAPEKKPAAAPTNAQVAAQPAAVLPKVEVKKGRITVLDMQLQQQEKEIAREEKLTKPTELDKALNDSKVSKSLSILGGQSAEYRANIAKERVSMLKDESDLIEAIAHAKTKEEKAQLQKDLDELRAYRRDLEKSLK